MPREKLNTKNYVIKPQDRHLAHEFDAILRTYEEKADAVQAQFKAEMDALNETCKAEASRAWYLLAQSVGIDAQETWGNPEYALDRTYLAESFAAIRYTQMEPHPLVGMFGGPRSPAVDEDPAKIEIPSKEKLN